MSATSATVNPFRGQDADRAEIWEMLVHRDSLAFVDRDWFRIAADFDIERFEGISANRSLHPDDWTIVYPTLAHYRKVWERMSRHFSSMRLVGTTPRELILRLTSLSQIDIRGGRALGHKKFLADEPLATGGRYAVASQTLYRLHRIGKT